MCSFVVHQNFLLDFKFPYQNFHFRVVRKFLVKQEEDSVFWERIMFSTSPLSCILVPENGPPS